MNPHCHNRYIVITTAGQASRSSDKIFPCLLSRLTSAFLMETGEANLQFFLTKF